MAFPKSPTSVTNVDGACGNGSTSNSSSFDILSKWYINGTLEHKQKTQERVKEDLVNEIKALEKQNDVLKTTLKNDAEQYQNRINGLENKVSSLINEREELKRTIINLEKSLLGEHNFGIELNAQQKAFLDFRDGLKNDKPIS